MEKTYDPRLIEPHWNQFWQAHHLAAVGKSGEPYCIMLPPPNVTGTLHMGHGFQHTLMDALIRRQRMLGKKTLWQPGTDHAGIATQMVVERQLNRQGINREDLGREAFIQKVWEWRDHSGSIITQQIKQLGNSLDWSRERYSMDEHMTLATHEAFIRLYDQGLIYRGHRLVNWDPKLLTAISDLEVTLEQRPGHLWHIRYPLVNGKGFVVVATTRPETLLGDTAVAVNPQDERYQHLIGELLHLPLTGRQIPIIADDSVDPEFGSGCVKITPAHDFNDYETGKRHDLPLINILTLQATINDEAPAPYRGLDRFEARKRIIADLTTQGLIETIEDYTINLPKGDRSGVVIEPLLTNQWYMKMKPLAEPAIAVIEQNRLRFIPENWTKTYLQWLENIQDWCISRQLWWGHQIPVWYDGAGNQYVGRDETDARQRHALAPDVYLYQDPDVLDTWFTAGIHPFATLGWPNITDAFKTFYPTQVLVTGFDIIFFWVARMVMMGLNLAGDVPFCEVYITGLIRDSQGQKMSKTKGNILDPLDLVYGIDLEKLVSKRTVDLMQPEMAPKIALATKKEFPEGIQAYGVDALRFTFCALANTGRDINFDMNRIAGYRNFCNKLWNASRFVLMNIKNDQLPVMTSPQFMINRWIDSRLQHTCKTVNQFFENYRFDLITQTIYEFIWNEYCDWYLELAKSHLVDESISATERLEIESTLIHILETLLRLLHPVMPFISEEIWQKIKALCGKTELSIMVASYPQFDATRVDLEAEATLSWLKQVIGAIRNMRSEIGISPAKKIQVIFHKGSAKDRELCEQYAIYLRSLARIDKISWHQGSEAFTASSVAVVNQLEIYLPLADLIDKKVELERLHKEITKLTKEQAHSSQKLNNPNYVEKAPKNVVDKEKQRLSEVSNLLHKLQQQYEEISNL